MFTKENFIKYFNQMLALEKKMEVAYQNIHGKVNSGYYKDFFRNMVNEEMAHGKIVEEIMKKFKG